MSPITLAAGASIHAGPIQFNDPVWLWAIPPAWALTIWIGRSSLSGMGTLTRRVALLVRLLVIGLVSAAMADPHLRETSETLAVMVVTDVSKSVPGPLQEEADRWVADAARAHQGETDELGVITAGTDAFVQALPSKRRDDIRVEKNIIGATDGTDLAQALRLSLAVRPAEAAYRVVLISDGNETAGNLLAAAEAARAAGVPIDVLPIRYRNESEVIVEDVVAPAAARMGEVINLKIPITATRATTGRVFLLINGETEDLDPEGPSLGWPVSLSAGPQTLSLPLTLRRGGPQQFEARFEPDQPPGSTDRPGDTVLENNRALAVTFVGGEGRVLIFANDRAETEQLELILSEAKIHADVKTPAEGPRSLTELNAYDAVIMADVPAYDFSQQQMEELKQYVHDSGGGLVMVGGPNSFGAGGWIGTPVEDALPVKLDPPQKKNMPRGALVLVMHSIEMPRGVYYGQQVANAAVDALSRLDLVGINEFRGYGGTEWVHPLSEVGDKSAVKQAINNLSFGDMPSFDPSLQLTLQALSNVQAGLKHAIIISDGDPSYSQNLLRQFVKERITISTVGVFPHSPSDLQSLQNIAQVTGGRYYAVTTNAQLATLPQIFFKEAQEVRRPLIWEGDPFRPAVAGVLAEPMRGVGGVPPLTGYVVTAEREGLATVTLRGQENDPIAAIWQYGMGRSFAFTSDAGSRWTGLWRNWDQFQAFWEQHVRWAMRATGDAKVRVVTEKRGDRTHVAVEAVDPSGERLNFARMQGRVARPDGSGEAIELVQVGPGRYEGVFSSELSGSYVMSLKYAAPREGGDPIEGTVQASVSRPFADEYRALTDNAALLQQVRTMTGGRELGADPTAPENNPWWRESITFPVATTPFRLALALAAITLFLGDVAVRRVRIDLAAIAHALVAPFSRAHSRGGEQLQGLRAARAKAQARIQERADRPGSPAQGAAGEPAPPSSAVAKTKFEASPDRPGRTGGPDVITGAAPPPQRPAAQPAAANAGDEAAMSRLLKAKRRAQDELTSEDQGPR